MTDATTDLILRDHARTLAERARQERARLALSSPERAFLLGVGAAAEEVLHPELGAAHDDEWLQREEPAFREGYLKTAAAISVARRQTVGAGGIPLPHPSRRGS